MRRLTNIKKSKSPPPATYSMDNPVFDDGNSVNPMHVRWVDDSDYRELMNTYVCTYNLYYKPKVENGDL